MKCEVAILEEDGRVIHHVEELTTSLLPQKPKKGGAVPSRASDGGVEPI